MDILRVLFISIPEECFIVITAFIIMKRYDLLDVNQLKNSIVNVMIPAIPTAAWFGINKLINTQNIIIDIIVNIIPFVILYMLLLFVYSRNYSTNKAKVFIGMLISFIIFALIEALTLFMITEAFNISISYIQDRFQLSLLFASLERIIGFGFVLFVLIKTNLNIDFKTIFQNTKIKYATLFIIIFNVTILSLSIKLALIDKILNQFPIIYRFGIMISIFSLVILNLICLWYTIGAIENKYKYVRYLNQNSLDIL